MTNFSDRLRKLRTEKGLLQRELAECLNVSRVAITQYENGSRSPDDESKKKIAEFFNVSLDYLMGNSDVRNPYLNEEQLKEYKKVVDILEDFRELLISKGSDEFRNSSLEELAELLIHAHEISKIANKNKSN